MDPSPWCLYGLFKIANWVPRQMPDKDRVSTTGRRHPRFMEVAANSREDSQGHDVELVRLLVVNLRLRRGGRLLAAVLLGGLFAAALVLSVRLRGGGGGSDRLAERLWRLVIVLLESADEDSDGQVLVVDELAVVFGVVQPVVRQRRVEVRVVVDREQDVVQLADRAEVVDRPDSSIYQL